MTVAVSIACTAAKGAPLREAYAVVNLKYSFRGAGKRCYVRFNLQGGSYGTAIVTTCPHKVTAPKGWRVTDPGAI